MAPPPGTGKILTVAGVVDSGGKLLDTGRKAFVADVVALLTKGNENGKGLLLAQALSVPVPPVGGPVLPAPSLLNPLAMEPILWFGPDPTAALSLPYLLDKEGIWSKIFVDGLYAGIASALNLNGSYVPPLFDPSIYFPDITFDLKVDIPTLAVKIPQILTPKIPKLILKLGVPSLPIPDLPAIPPSIPLPKIPDMPIPPPIDFGIPLAFPDFFVKLIAGIPSLVIPAVPVSLPGLFLAPFKALLDIFIKLLVDLKLILVSPKLLMATILVILQNVAVMIVCDIIGLILGAGAISTSAAIFGGLALPQ
jgi:hypothetical protein